LYLSQCWAADSQRCRVAGVHERLSHPRLSRSGLDDLYKIGDRTKIRDGKVANRPIYVALAVTADGTRDILGLWAGDGGEDAKFWFQVLTELRSRGVGDVCMVVFEDEAGHTLRAPKARTWAWPDTGDCGVR
jgi:hypothetical protein